MPRKSHFHLTDLKDILKSNKYASIAKKTEELKTEIKSNLEIIESESEWQKYSKSIQDNLLEFIKIVESTKEDLEKNAKEQYEIDYKEYGTFDQDKYIEAYRETYQANITGLHKLKKYVQTLETHDEVDDEIESIEVGDLIKTEHLHLLALALERLIKEFKEDPDADKSTTDLLKSITKKSISNVLAQSFIKGDGKPFRSRRIADRDYDTKFEVSKGNLMELISFVSKLSRILTEEYKNPVDRKFFPSRK